MKALEIKKKLDKIVVGQEEAKKVIIMAIMQRFKRISISDNSVKNNIRPFNILIKGPSGSGKTYTISQLSKILDIPFYKTSLTQYSEVGYVGKNIEDIFKDLYKSLYKQINKSFYNKILKSDDLLEDICTILSKIYIKQIGDNIDDDEYEEEIINEVNKNEGNTNTNSDEDISLDVLLNNIESNTSSKTDKIKDNHVFIKEALMKYFKDKEYDNEKNKEILNTIIQIRVKKRISVNTEPFGSKFVVKPVTINKPLKDLIYDLCEDLIYSESELYDSYVEFVKQQLENSIIFLDEIDKIADKNGNERVSRGGVQNGLLTLLSGTDIYLDEIDTTISTNHVLFIAAGAFQSGVDINDLKDEILGRFPITINMKSLNKDDYVNILKYASNNVLEQQINLLKFNGISIDVDDEVISKIAKYTEELNSISNIGARRLTPFIVGLLSEFIYYESSEFNSDDKVKEIMEKYGYCKIENDTIHIKIKPTKYVNELLDSINEKDINKYKSVKKISL